MATIEQPAKATHQGASALGDRNDYSAAIMSDAWRSLSTIAFVSAICPARFGTVALKIAGWLPANALLRMLWVKRDREFSAHEDCHEWRRAERVRVNGPHALSGMERPSFWGGGGTLSSTPCGTDRGDFPL